MITSRRRKVFSLSTKVLFIFVFVVFVIIPLITMLSNTSAVDFVKVVNSPRFSEALRNSIVLSLIATFISVAMGYTLAWCIVRSGIKIKRLLLLLFTLPMLIPSISHGIGLIILFGRNGLLTRGFGGDINIYGSSGIILGSVMYSFPVAVVMIRDILSFEDASSYEAARVLGLNGFQRFAAITFPYVRRPLIAVMFAVFSMIATDYGVPLTLGDTATITLPVMMYQDVIGAMDFGKGGVIGLFLLAPAVAAFLIDLLNRDKGNNVFVLTVFPSKQSKVINGVCYLICSLTSLFVLLPIGAFVLLTFAQKYPSNLDFSLRHIQRTIDMGGWNYLLTSIGIAFSVAIIGTAIACSCGYITSRLKSPLTKLLHLAAITSLAIPGLVLGLSYAMTFKDSLIYKTVVILVIVNIVHFVASPYLMFYNSLGKLNENLEAVGETLGISRVRSIFNIILPSVRSTMLESFVYLFANSMMTISAVSFLFSYKAKPISLMITEFQSTAQLECAAFVSLVILVVNIFIRLTINMLKINECN